MRAGRLSSRILVVCVAMLLGTAGLVAAFGVQPLPPRSASPHPAALPPGDDTWLDRVIAPRLAEYPGESAFRLVTDGVEAFALRALSARRAGRSLDVQTYIWHADLTGALLIHEIVRAADRGVRVRVLLDDLDARAKNFELAALDAHRHIEVRIFNPFATREGIAGKIIEGLTSFSRINRRMHNKTWIADNRFALAGGRNIGDEYFTASERVNFVDLDFAMLGPAVLELSSVFDRYWNAAVVWPMAALHPSQLSQAGFESLRARARERYERAARSPYVVALADNQSLQRMAAQPDATRWSKEFRVLADDPDKARAADPLARSPVLQALVAAVREAERAVTLVSAYFVPGERGTQLLARRAQRGVAVSILTNSLAATDVIAVHAGYAKYRDALIASGAQLWELKASPTQTRELTAFGASHASLHTKAALFDQQRLFVGSFNLDPRSSSLNCEQGVLVSEATLAAQAEALFTRMRSGEHAWRIGHAHDGKLEWTDERASADREPGASLARRIFARMVRWLPIESQL